MMKKLLGAGLLAIAAMASLPAQAQTLGGVTVIGNKLRFEMDQWIMFDDLKAQTRESLNYLGYGEIMYSQNDPDVFTADNDARCAYFSRTTLKGVTSTSDFASQAAKALALINQFKGPSSSGGLGAARPARSGVAAQPSGYATLVTYMPKDSNGFYIMTVIWADGSSTGFKLIVPGGSAGDKNTATLVSTNPVAWIKTPGQTAPLQEDKAACPF